MSDNEIKYIEYKLKGWLDSKKLYQENNSTIKFEGTIALTFQKDFNISKEEYNSYLDKHSNIQKIKNKFTSSRQKDVDKQGFTDIKEFYYWYFNIEKKCCYCGIEEKELNKYFNNDNIQYKDARPRGKTLEIERIVTAPKNKNLYTKENCALACYICNNAKSDFISPSNFKPIAKGIYEFWKTKIQIEIDFPEKSEIWSK